MLEDCKSSYTELVQDWNNLLIGLSNQLDKINNSLHSTHFARNLGLIFDEHLTISDHYLICLHIFLLPHSSALLYPSIPHSKLDYCNSLYRNLPKSRKTRLQKIQNSLARAVVKASNSSHITPILPSLYWLKITLQCALNTSSSDLCTKFSQPPNLHICISS